MFLSLYQVNVDFLIYKSNEQRFIIQQIFYYPWNSHCIIIKNF